ncbi:AraC family transcriptional regulator [Paenibacillus roseipurpureus]|uniref:AraC family transcriptional regulator n=1 Tax=Paenibacillus roseopurpureus TaxID=2918901 RepID=A0AA96LTR3_9BACL|nr:AraC family transcriptional regulator [Paenibacillus sp. MBLB1832]WNR47007.1 AraC family transcriptional regulator [Paenibacillus sp. MBLB1832]
MHHHDFIKLVYITGGQAEHQYMNENCIVQEGEVFLKQPEVEHAYRVPGGGSLEGYNILFLPDLLEKEFQTLSTVASFVDFFYVKPFLRESNVYHVYMHLNSQQRIEMKLLMDRLTKEFTHKLTGYRILIKTSMIDLFVYLSRIYELKAHKPLTQWGSDAEVIKHISHYIDLHHAQPLSLEQVSQLCGMSVSSFKNKFKLYIGKTFLEYRKEVRLTIAKELLVETDDKIVTISQKVGLEDLSFFNKIFKEMEELSPGNYRKMHRKL